MRPGPRAPGKESRMDVEPPFLGPFAWSWSEVALLLGATLAGMALHALL